MIAALRRGAPVIALAVLALAPIVVQDGYTRHLFIIAFIFAIIAAS